MLTSVHPKLPMRDKKITRDFFINQLSFADMASADYEAYLILGKDQVQIHFFLHKELDITENYGQLYIRTDNIDELYNSFLERGVRIHPNGQLEVKPWKQKEFSILDPDNNLLTFGQAL